MSQTDLHNAVTLAMLLVHKNPRDTDAKQLYALLKRLAAR